MQVKRFGLKLYADDGVAVDLPAMIPVFHRWIQQGSVPGLLIDVADYQHVHEGPGVLLVGHECDYSMDLGEGRPGLSYVRKRATGELADVLPEAFGALLLACEALEQETSLSVRFGTNEALVSIYDRLAAPNNSESFEAVRVAVEAIARRLYGDATLTLQRGPEDARAACAVRIKADQRPAIGEMIGRLSD